MILSLNGTFLMASAVLNQVCCEQKGCLLKRMFSLQSLGAVQPDWLHALSKSLSRDYNTISSHYCKVSDILNFCGKTCFKKPEKLVSGR